MTEVNRLLRLDKPRNWLLAGNLLAIVSATLIVSEALDPLGLVLGIPIAVFFPGYALFVALVDREEDPFPEQRIVLAFGWSIAAGDVAALILNYLPWGFHLELVLESSFLLLWGASAVAWHRSRLLYGIHSLRLQAIASRSHMQTPPPATLEKADSPEETASAPEATPDGGLKEPARTEAEPLRVTSPLKDSPQMTYFPGILRSPEGTKGSIMAAYRRTVRLVATRTGVAGTSTATLREFWRETSAELTEARQFFSELTRLAEEALYSAKEPGPREAKLAEQLAQNVENVLKQTGH